MSDDHNFKEPFNIWWLVAILAVFIAMPMINVLAGWFVYWL